MDPPVTIGGPLPEFDGWEMPRCLLAATANRCPTYFLNGLVLVDALVDVSDSSLGSATTGGLHCLLDIMSSRAACIIIY